MPNSDISNKKDHETIFTVHRTCFPLGHMLHVRWINQFLHPTKPSHFLSIHVHLSQKNDMCLRHLILALPLQGRFRSALLSSLPYSVVDFKATSNAGQTLSHILVSSLNSPDYSPYPFCHFSLQGLRQHWPFDSTGISRSHDQHNIACPVNQHRPRPVLFKMLRPRQEA
jgi:hypothetical protein